MLPYKCGPTEALGFTKRGAELCIKAMGSSKAPTEGFRTESSNGGISNGGSHITAGTTPRKKHLRAMDVGCSVGGVTFELTKGFDEVRKEGLVSINRAALPTKKYQLRTPGLGLSKVLIMVCLLLLQCEWRVKSTDRCLDCVDYK